MSLCSLLGDVVQFVPGVDRVQHDTHSSRQGNHRGDISCGNGAWAVDSPIGSTLRDRRCQRYVGTIGGLWVHLDGGEVVRIGRIWVAMHDGPPPHRCQRDDAMVQCCTATHYQIPAIGVGSGKLQAWVGIQVQTALVHPPAPRLRVINRRCPGRQCEECTDRLSIQRWGGHGSGIRCGFGINAARDRVVEITPQRLTAFSMTLVLRAHHDRLLTSSSAQGFRLLPAHW
ncbi:hypothetical protein A5656_25685 [Mycobacterium gordonae]|nr:hypothetical protein A5656_25685 [Mycobacterium gordonae]